MRRMGWLGAALAIAVALPAPMLGSAATSASSSNSMCPPASPTPHPAPAAAIRFGIDPGLAGNPFPSLKGPVPVNHAAEARALRALKPTHRALMIRLNRLFWSGGEGQLRSFARRATSYARQGYGVEVQVRYHPTSANNGKIAAWSRWVQHVVDVLGADKSLESLTITNEVNLAISPNTSDGYYKSAEAALVHGVEAAYGELRRRHWAHRVKVGFTFAYRLNPSSDIGLFNYLGSHGGPAFRRALGFVGLDDYPGTVYPPTLVPGVDSAGDELASALATMRTCFLRHAKIGPKTPLWVTENGFPSNNSETTQSAALRSMVVAVHRYGGTYNVTDYRWFNLRDNNSQGNGLFDQDGLMRDNDARKPSFAAYGELIQRYGTGPSPAG